MKSAFRVYRFDSLDEAAKEMGLSGHMKTKDGPCQKELARSLPGDEPTCDSGYQ